MTTVIEFMSNVAKEIIDIKPDSEKTMSDLWNEFYDIMRKYGIKQGTKTPQGGCLCNNSEWTMCVTLFLQCVTGSIQLDEWFNVPEDLECYDTI
jgi:hypothetical protein